MNTTQHTPGPWTIVKNGVTAYILPPFGSDDACITSVYIEGNGKNITKNIANASLIAAAPELLEALEMVEQVWSEGAGHQVNPESPLGQVRAAIAKAKGQQ